jgi:DNA-binding response OmpR family regulator
MLILIRSDNPILSELVARNLERRGFDVRETASASAACPSATQERRPDLVVVDLDTQEPEQWERAERVRNAMPSMPLVFLGHAWPTVARLARLRPCAYVRKPFAIDALLAAIRRAPQNVQTLR